MKLLAIGLSHHTAPVDLRERIAVPDEELAEALRRVAERATAVEAMLLSTCNRVEAYFVASDEKSARARAAEVLAATSLAVAPDELGPHLYVRDGLDAARHLFRVAASLDSAVVGEPQILGQVKEAWERAIQAGTAGPQLHRLVPRAFATAKRVRTETGIARASASVASAAVELGRRIFGSLQGREVLVLGAGKMGDLAARHLISAGCRRLLVCNRTRARADALAERLRAAATESEAKVEVEVHALDDLPLLLVRADIALCSTGAPRPLVTREAVQRAMKARKGRWLCLLDIAVPRDVEPAVGNLENVYLYDVDHLGDLVEENLTERRKEAAAAEKIVDEELARFQQSESARGVVPTIRLLRERCLEVARGEAEKSLARLGGAASEKERRELELLAEGIVNKLLHGPLTALKREADSDELAAAARTLFGLDLSAAPGSPELTGEVGPRGSSGGLGGIAPGVGGVAPGVGGGSRGASVGNGGDVSDASGAANDPSDESAAPRPARGERSR